MALVIAKTVRFNRMAYRPGDEEALSMVIDKKAVDSLKARGLLIEAKAQKSVVPKKGGTDFTAAAVELLKEAGYKEQEYDGPATGASGDVLKSDVEDWLAEKA